MQIGIIAPPKYLHFSSQKMHLCYASLLHNRDYFDYYTRKAERVILDTSPILPRRVNLDLLLEGIGLVKPALVVLPSVDYSCERTITIAKSFLRLSKSGNFVGVVQGLDLDSLHKCYNFLKNCCSIIGLPSPLETIARRDEIARDLCIKEKLLYIEVYSNPYEEVPPPTSLGICTSFPVRLAANLRKLSEYSPTPPPLDFGRGDLIEELVKGNIEEYLEVVKYERKRET